MSSRFPRQLIGLGALALMLALSPGQAASQEVGGIGRANETVIRWDAASPVTELKSGEVQVRTAAVFIGQKGDFYSVSLSFQNRADYEAALTAGAKGFKLSDLESLWTLRTGDRVQQIARPGAKRVLDQARTAASPLCGNVAARGLVRLQGDLHVGVSLLAPASANKVLDEADPDAEPGEEPSEEPSEEVDGDFVHDIHGACDFFAAGGCGSDPCYNSLLSGGRITIFKGDCRELEVLGPNTCYCHSTSIVT